VDSVNAELAGSPADPFKRLVAGQVLADLGLYQMAAEQYAQADKLQPDYVLREFKRTFEANHFSPPLLFLYLQDKYPDDPALLLYAARRNLQALTYSQKEKEQAMSNALKELARARALPNPWPGTYSLLAMIEYNSGHLEKAISYTDMELKKNPDEPLARKVKILAFCKQGKRPVELIDAIASALKIAPRDDELNLLLARALVAKHDYNNAIKPALLGLFDQHDPATLNESRSLVFELIKKADREQFNRIVNEISYGLSDPGSNGRGFRSTVMRMRLADLYVLADERKLALKELEAALRMHPHFRAAVAFRIGKELAAMHRYFEAFPYFDMACHLNQNGIDQQMYLAMRTRIARVGLNSQRDLALRIKTMFDRNLPGSSDNSAGNPAAINRNAGSGQI